MSSSHSSLDQAVAKFAGFDEVEDQAEEVEIVNFVPGHDQLPIDVDVKERRPWHGAAATMMLRGEGILEIAKMCRVSLDHVRCLKNQEWFQVWLRELQTELKKDSEGLVKSLAFDAIFKLHELATSRDVPPGVARSACSDLLDRCPEFVKVKERKSTRQELPDDPVEALKQLQQEEAALTEQLAGLPDTSV
jgi:hypothetical protein